MIDQSFADVGQSAPPPRADGADVLPGPQAAVFQSLEPPPSAPATRDVKMLLDVPVQMTVHVGKTKIAVRNLLQIKQGAVVELDGLAGEPMSVYINGHLVAEGEVVVVNDRFAIRLTDIITPAERIRRLRT